MLGNLKEYQKVKDELIKEIKKHNIDDNEINKFIKDITANLGDKIYIHNYYEDKIIFSDDKEIHLYRDKDDKIPDEKIHYLMFYNKALYVLRKWVDVDNISMINAVNDLDFKYESDSAYRASLPSYDYELSYSEIADYSLNEYLRQENEEFEEDERMSDYDRKFNKIKNKKYSIKDLGTDIYYPKSLYSYLIGNGLVFEHINEIKVISDETFNSKLDEDSFLSKLFNTKIYYKKEIGYADNYYMIFKFDEIINACEWHDVSLLNDIIVYADNFYTNEEMVKEIKDKKEDIKRKAEREIYECEKYEEKINDRINNIKEEEEEEEEEEVPF